MKANIKKLTIGLSSVTMLGFLSSSGVFATNTNITASVGKIIDCSGLEAEVNLGTIAPGEVATKDFSVSITTNSVSGFAVTASKLNDLVRIGGTEAFTYNTVITSSLQNYSISPKTFGSEWSTMENGAIQEGSVWSHGSGGTASETLTVTVSAGNGIAGTYTGTVEWICSTM